ncbi:MAG: diaminopimelate epimerase [Chlamydiota bacterium]|nr:diaminopimelate epimerase [Chlamydiota bacterium]
MKKNALRQIKFSKTVGAGNDFIVIRQEDFAIERAEVPRLCDRKYGIGADGILLIEPSDVAEFRMRIINADGSEAEMCGNGIRCAAQWAFNQKLVDDVMQIETLSGVLEVSLTQDGPKVRMPDPTDFSLNQKIEIDGVSYTYHQVNTGVPHIVIFEKNVLECDVHHVGHQLRNHERFKPKGTNVNFVQVIEHNRLRVRTYERGVESETLACGTGVTACALISNIIHELASPIEVLTSGGECIQIDFEMGSKNQFLKVYMTGPVTIVYEGVIEL